MSRAVIASLAVLLVASVALNALVLSFYMQNYTVEQMFERFAQKYEADLPLDLPAYPDIYPEHALSMSFENSVKTRSDYAAWSRGITEKFAEMSDLPGPDVSAGSVTAQDLTSRDPSYRTTKLWMDAHDGDRIIFYELRPAAQAGPGPAVFVIPGSGDQGALDVLDLDGPYSEHYYHMGIGDKLAKHGYAVYVIENRGWGERAIDAGFHCRGSDVYCTGKVLANHLQSVGQNLHKLQMADNLRVLDFIRGRDHVDAENIALVGLSLGGSHVIGTAVLNQDVRSVVSASGLVSHDKLSGAWGSSEPILHHFDYPDLAASLAPMPIYMSWGAHERSGFGFEAETQYSADYVRGAYSMLGAEGNVTAVVHQDSFNSGHTFDLDSVFDFLSETIGGPEVA